MTSLTLNARLGSAVLSLNPNLVRENTSIMGNIQQIANQLDCPDATQEHDRLFVEKLATGDPSILENFEQGSPQRKICEMLMQLSGVVLENVVKGVHDDSTYRGNL